MEPNAAAATLNQAAATLTQAIKDNKDPPAWSALVQALSVVATRMEPKEAKEATATLIQTIKDSRYPIGSYNRMAQCLSTLAARMDPKEAADATAEVAPVLFWSMASESSRLRIISAQNLAVLLSTVSPAEVCWRTASAIGTGMGHALTALLVLGAAAAEPLPCRLSTPQLVELLKYPSCVGEARRVVLDSLGQRYQRRFADLWEFVAYAHEYLSDLDLTSPPKRPQP